MKKLLLSLIIACATWVVGLAQETYAVEIRPTLNGYVISDKATAAQGETVTLTLAHAPFYDLEQLLVGGELSGGGISDDDPWEPAWAPGYVMIPTTKVSENTYTFVMPASKVKVMVTFAPIVIGDVDGNGVVNISDVTTLIDLLLNSSPYLDRADVDRNGVVNISDLTVLIDILMNGN